MSSVYKNETFTLTFGDQAENHVGMQKIGELAAHGFSLEDIEKSKKWFESKNVVCELHSLHDILPKEHQDSSLNAYVLVARKAVNAILDSTNGADQFFTEQKKLEKDTKAFMYGRVVNKNARHNLCFGDESQEPNYADGKGRIIAFKDVPLLSKLRSVLPTIIGDHASNLAVEGNYYYDVSKCGIGFHGDTERRKVVGVRVGATIPLHYVWFYKGSKIAGPVKLNLGHGDVYIMSEKATGQDWKKKNICTLRHAAGATKFLTIKEKKKTTKSPKKEKKVKDEEESDDDDSEDEEEEEETKGKKKKSNGKEEKNRVTKKKKL